MDKIRVDYDSDSSEDMNSSEDIEFDPSVSDNRVRKVYLITHSQADLDVFPTRQSFANAVLKSFENVPAQVLQWCCCIENHRDGGVHFHMAIKFDRNQRWICSKRRLEELYGISVHFSSVHYNYYSAWKYVTKCDLDFVESPSHPNLRNPRTTAASLAIVAKANSTATEKETKPDRIELATKHRAGDESTAEQEAGEGKKRKRRLSSYEVSQIIIENGINNRLELLALAHSQELEGKTDLAEFVVNRGTKVVNEVIATAWDLIKAKEKLCRAQKTRIQLLVEAKGSECVEGCSGEWLKCAREVLLKNGIFASYFGDSIRELLEKGRGKYRNIMIIGPTNCAKTFILLPLTIIYNTFCNPASTSFAWVGAEEAECLFLNDFRWSQTVIPWHDFLLMLEGELVHLPAPKTYYSRDLAFDRDTPIFCTGKNSFIYVKGGTVDQRETDMMSVRWRTFHFNHQIPERDHKELKPCPRCFSRLILGEEN